MQKGNRFPLENPELARDEIEAILRGLGFYQIHLFDEMEKAKKQNSENDIASIRAEAQKITSAIKKVHKLIEP